MTFYYFYDEWITCRWLAVNKGDRFEIFVRPFYALAIVDIIRHYGWQDIWYLYSNDEGLRHS